MKVLVLVEDYPSNTSKILMYVHVRNKYYMKKGMEVTVLNKKIIQEKQGKDKPER